MICPRCKLEAKSSRVVRGTKIFFIHGYDKGIPQGCVVNKVKDPVLRGRPKPGSGFRLRAVKK